MPKNSFVNFVFACYASLLQGWAKAFVFAFSPAVWITSKQMIRFSAVWWACTELGHVSYNPGMYNYLSKYKIVSGHVILAYFCDLHSQLLPSWFTRRFPQLQSTVGLNLPCQAWENANFGLSRGFSANAIQSKFSKVRIEWWGSSSSSSTSFKIWTLIINCWCCQFQIKMSMIKTGNWTDKVKFNNLFQDPCLVHECQQ